MIYQTSIWLALQERRFQILACEKTLVRQCRPVCCDAWCNVQAKFCLACLVANSSCRYFTLSTTYLDYYHYHITCMIPVIEIPWQSPSMSYVSLQNHIINWSIALRPADLLVYCKACLAPSGCTLRNSAPSSRHMISWSLRTRFLDNR